MYTIKEHINNKINNDNHLNKKRKCEYIINEYNL